jgi:hypothetical protein
MKFDTGGTLKKSVDRIQILLKSDTKLGNLHKGISMFCCYWLYQVAVKALFTVTCKPRAQKEHDAAHHIFIKVPAIKLHQYVSSGSWGATCGQASGQTEMTKVIGAFQEYWMCLKIILAFWLLYSTLFFFVLLLTLTLRLIVQTEHVTFPMNQWLHEHVTMLHYTYNACYIIKNYSVSVSRLALYCCPTWTCRSAFDMMKTCFVSTGRAFSAFHIIFHATQIHKNGTLNNQKNKSSTCDSIKKTTV